MSDPVISRIAATQKALAALSAKSALKAFFFSPQSHHFPADETGVCVSNGVHIDLLPQLHEILTRKGQYDIGIICCHAAWDESYLFELRKQEAVPFLIAWFWDNHHHHINNLRQAYLVDLGFLSHWHDRQYLNLPAMLPGPHLPAYSRQWSPASIDRYFPQGLPAQRSDALLGGFGRYSWAPDRNAFLETLMREIPGHALSLGSIDDYFKASPDARAAAWANHKAHLIVPMSGDVSTRVYEALMTGQIPLVPTDAEDMDKVIPPEIQATLPVLRYQPYSVQDVERVWREALRQFDAEGIAGVSRRNVYARTHHSLQSRLAVLTAFIRAPWPFELTTNGITVFWKNWI